jgi:hypothetical protein
MMEGNNELKKTERATERMAEALLKEVFLPVHEHTGFDNGITTRQVHEFLVEKFKLNTKHELNCPYFSLWLSYKISKSLQLLQNPKSRLFLRGLVSKRIKGIQDKPEYNYFFLLTKDEQRKVHIEKTEDIKCRTKKEEQKIIIEGNKHLLSLTHDGKKQMGGDEE